MDRIVGKFIPVVALAFAGVLCSSVRGEIIAAWDFDYDSVTDVWGDSDGTIHGAACFAAGRPGAGKALELTGIEYARIGNESRFDVTDAMTVAAWIKVHAFDRPWQAIVTKGNTAWRLQRNASGKTLEFACSGLSIPGGSEWGSLPGKGSVDDGKWHHVVGVYDGSKMSLYVDGALDASQKASGKIAINDEPVCIGENSEEGRRCFKGLMDDVVILNHALDVEAVKRLHREGPVFLMPGTMADEFVQEAGQMVATLAAKEAVATLSRKISEYTQSQGDANEGSVYRDRYVSPDVYFLLAQAKEAASVPGSEVTGAYLQVVKQVPYRTHHVIDALLWLSEHLPVDEYATAAREFARCSRVLSYDVHQVAGRFERRDDWAGFERFWDALLSGMDLKGESAYACMSAAWTALRENESWARRFLDYCRSRRELTPHLFRRQEKLAVKHIEAGDFQKAAQVYRTIAGQCGPHETRAVYEYRRCECAFNANLYEDALQALNAFVAQYGKHDQAPIAGAMMLRGRCLVNVGQIDEAIDTFLDVSILYPQGALAAEASFLMGYCLIIQGRFEEATEGLQLVVRDYPQSEYAGKARLYLNRIETMAK